ncbi:uncharacterized protein LODBEIA_P05450 [Lodderomyces beijingensis]|uniref:LisH domain-containing protein n=1 Tax=Lodderomyces beijingensis TaxID=1775926 RepID=A0ABP0ZGP8_9ASCO
MPRDISPSHELIAHFLKDNGYGETLAQFEKEHGKPIQPKLLNNVESLSDIIEDRLNYNTLVEELNKSNIDSVAENLPPALKAIADSQFEDWISPFPHTPRQLDGISALILSSAYDAATGDVYFTTNDGRVLLRSRDEEIKSFKLGEIIKKVMIIDNQETIALLAMSGMLYLKRTRSLESISQFATGSRFVVDAQYIRLGKEDYIVTLAWNNSLKLSRVKAKEKQVEQVSELKLNQQGTCFGLTIYRDRLVLLLGKLDNTLLEVYTLEGEVEEEDGKNKFELKYKISINDAEFTTASFSPRRIIIWNSGEHAGEIPLVAVATSHEPYMRVIITSLIDFDAVTSTSTSTEIRRNQIIRNLNTMSPQDKFSQPIIAWRLGTEKNNNNKVSGIWVMGDDGVIRGMDVVSGDVAVELKDDITNTGQGQSKSQTNHGKIKEFIGFVDQNRETLISCAVDKSITQWT